MKKILSVLIVMLMSINISAFAATTTGTNAKAKTEKTAVPTNLIVKQSITFKDGKKIVVYYKKSGEQCKLYSTSDLSKFSVTDLLNIQTTTFEQVDKVEGKCYASKTVSALIALAKKHLRA